MGGIKWGKIIICCVGLVVVGIGYEMGTVGMGGLTGGDIVIRGITSAIGAEERQEKYEDLDDR